MHIYVILIVCIMEVIKWKFQRYEFILILLPCLWFEVVVVPKVLYFDLTTRYVHFYCKPKKGKREECIGISVGQIIQHVQACFLPLGKFALCISLKTETVKNMRNIPTET